MERFKADEKLEDKLLILYKITNSERRENDWYWPCLRLWRPTPLRKRILTSFGTGGTIFLAGVTLILLVSCTQGKVGKEKKPYRIGVHEATFALNHEDLDFPLINRASEPSKSYQKDASLKVGVKYGHGIDHFSRADSIKNGYFQRWIWCGTTCWIVVNDADREVMLFDGYVSKYTLGNSLDGDSYSDLGSNGELNAVGLDHSYQLDRIVSLANFLRYLCDPEEWNGHPYTFIGILALHEHGDHTGDLQHLLLALELAKKDHLNYTKHIGVDSLCPDTNGGNGSGIDSICDSMQSEFEARFEPIDTSRIPIVSHYATTRDFHRSKNTQYPNPFSHYFIPAHEDGTECDQHLHGGHFTARANLYKRRSGKRLDCNACSQDGSFKLGHFEIQPYVWDHLSIVGYNGYRTLAYRVWHADAPESRVTFLNW